MESPPSEMTTPSNSTNTAMVVGIGVGGAFLLLFAVGVFVFFYKRRNHPSLPTTIKPQNPNGEQAQQYQHNVPQSINNVVHEQPKSDPPPEVSPKIQSTKPQPEVSPSASDELPGLSPSSSLGTFTYEELASATDHFSSSNLLGQGGFGYVYKGVLPDGKEIAVKLLKSESNQGEREFQAEIDTISRVHHRHLLELVGSCIFGKKLMLVYEFIPNKTLEYHLHRKIWPPMSWEKRLKIALGAAKGLAYLHEECHPKIIHRDIKAVNILIDNEFEAKVADFGLAKFFADTDTHVSTRVMGTYGYIAPEYAASGKLTEKSDVYSFGVVLLELITGRRPSDNARPSIYDSMVDWVRPLLIQALESGDFDEVVDKRLWEYDLYEMTQMIACATACVRRGARRRPLMSQVVRALEGKLSAEDLLKEIAPVNKTFHKSLDFDSNVQVKIIALDKRTIHGSLDYDSNAQFLKDLQILRELNLGSFENPHDDFTIEQTVPSSTSSIKNRHDAQEIDIGNSRTGATDVFEIAID